jgi:hypothetical protein
MKPEWLPACCATNGDWAEVVAALYAVFRRDIVDNPPRVDGCRVWWQQGMSDGYEETFWHLITRDDAATGDRLFDPRRAERLSWCGPILRHCNDPAITRWRYRESRGQIRLYLWLEPWDYVVVLEEKDGRGGRSYFLITAYHPDGEDRRRSLRRKHEKKEP